MEEEQQQQALFKQLYDSLKPTVWIVRMSGIFQGNDMTRYCTAFAVTKDGLLMSCGSGTWPAWRPLTIEVRRLDGNHGFDFKANPADLKRESDLSMLQIIDGAELKDNEFVRFGSGSLNVFENVIAIGHPYRCAGAGLFGRVVYQCTKDTDYELDDPEVCLKYQPDALINTSLYRKLGHFLNDLYFRERPNIDLSFQKRLQANLPVIQSSGLIGGEGAWGAPIFNFGGELVGMLMTGMHRYELGVHVTALKKFLDQYLNSQNKGPGDEKNVGEGSEDAKGKHKASTSISMKKK